jgi:hypothetical protein
MPNTAAVLRPTSAGLTNPDYLPENENPGQGRGFGDKLVNWFQ